MYQQIKKKLFKYIKSKRNDIAGVSPPTDKRGKTHTEDDEIANIINDHYCNVFSKDNGIIPNILGPRGSNITNIQFTRNGIIKLLKNLDPKKASDLDNIASRFLKECAEEIADALVFVIDVSMEQGEIPED